MLKTIRQEMKWWMPLIFAALITVLVGSTQLVGSQQLIAHPLMPLTAREIKTAVAAIQKEKPLPEGAFFSQISLQEPDKQAVLNFQSGDRVDRKAFAMIYDRPSNQTYEAVVDLETAQLESWQTIPDVQPALSDPDFDLATEVVKADSRWQAAMRKRGMTDFEALEISAWAPGVLSETERARGNRIARALTYYKGDRWNYYGRPIEGVIAVVDLNAAKVVRLIDNPAIPFSQENWDYDLKSLGKLRRGAKPLRTVQPDGVSFDILGNQVSWQGWKLRYSMHPREGLVLYQVSFNDGSGDRPVMYRGSLSEMIVPYADPDPNWSFRNAFDVGEYNFGILCSPMELGKDIPENGVLIDAVFADAEGEPYTLPGAIGIYERDRGILWKHYDYVTERTYARRDRQLVIATTGAIDNYDYGINWVFGQDGSIEVESDMSGIVLAKATAAESVQELDRRSNYGSLVAKNILGITHQHYFNFRLDLDIDGQANEVMEMSLQSFEKDEANPLGNAFKGVETMLETESKAVQDIDTETSRSWMMTSTTQRNTLGAPTSYMLMPTSNAFFQPGMDADITNKAGFATHHFWVTRYKGNELYGAGWYPNQGRSSQGLPSYIADNESLVGEDLVLWYSLGVSHVPRPEDWPVMPVHRVSFKLIPWGFFSRNPAINLPE